MSDLLYYLDGGTGDRLEVYENYLIVRHIGLFRFLMKPEMLGDRLIYICNIEEVHLKRAGWTAGHLRFVLTIRDNSVISLLSSGNTALTITFVNGDHVNETAEAIKAYIEEKISKPKGPHMQNVIQDEDELQKLKKLLDGGLVTEAVYAHRSREIMEQRKNNGLLDS
ncbi:hypothetical protein [Paenibacillus marinisediminis]